MLKEKEQRNCESCCNIHLDSCSCATTVWTLLVSVKTTQGIWSRRRVTADNAARAFHLCRCCLEKISALTAKDSESFFIQLWDAETCFLWRRPRSIKPQAEAALYLRFVCQGLLSENKQLAMVRVLCLSLWDVHWRLHIMLCSSLLFTHHRLPVKWYKWMLWC